jgi:hypothetical protein
VKLPASFFACFVYAQCALGFYLAANKVMPSPKIEAHKIIVSIAWPMALMGVVVENQLLQMAQRCVDLPGFCRHATGFQ